MNSIFSNRNSDMIKQFAEFRKFMQNKDPNAMLQSLLSSGRFSQADVDRAQEMANLFKDILRK